MTDPKDVVIQSAFATPPLVTAYLKWIKGVTLNEWVALASLVSIVLHAAYLVWKWRREAKGEKL